MKKKRYSRIFNKKMDYYNDDTIKNNITFNLEENS